MLILTAAIALLLPVQAQVPPSPPPPCSAAENRQMDFWVGDWDLTFTTPNGQVGHATNRISRDEFGDCAIIEHFLQPGGGRNGADYRGSSMSMHDPETGVWRQMWVDDGGGSFLLTGGPVEGQPYVFELRTTEPIGQGTKAYMRMIWQDVGQDDLVWRWQQQAADGSWTDQWVLNYHRKPAQ